ncbi:exocyst complex subunit Sec15-like-domain-containing protein [Scheffersomyces coipomensis]|uniref:exocyst complex subunit Sec15-like-domain-containing protein n=1 Tax=Scheffersomyces coipomensis TaxID=1788519 RepID=UPI00315D08B9
MAPSATNGANGHHVKSSNGKSTNGSSLVDTIPLENLLLRDDDIFETSLHSEDYLDSLAPILKDSIKANGLGELISRLNGIVDKKDDELNKLSLDSTDEINACIDSIDNINEISYGLNANLNDISKQLHKSAYDLMSRKKHLIKSKEVSTHINETMIVLNECIQVLEITNKIHDLIKAKKYFNALKLLDELTNIHLSKVENFNFGVKIYESVPLLTKMIKDESFDNLCKWLSINSERRLSTISDGIYDNLYNLQRNWYNLKKNKPTFKPYKLNSPVEISLRDPTLNYNIFEDETLQITLDPLFDVILVYQTLHESSNLNNLYHKEWIKKYNRVIYPITSAASANTSNIVKFNDTNALGEYLRKIAAFFVMDKQINLTTKYQLRYNLNADDLWNSYVSKLKPVLLNYLKTTKFKSISDLSDFKDLIGNFLQILENYNYRITDLYEVLVITFRDYFAPFKIQEFTSEFIKSIQSDHYMPLTIDDKADYEGIMEVIWYKNDELFAPAHVKRMPITFPFSEDYVHFCLGIHSLLNDILSFIDQHYGYELNDINNIIVNEIFERVLGNEKGYGIVSFIHDFIVKNDTNKEITSQSYTNLEYYLYSTYQIGKLINRRLRIHTGLGIHNIDANDTFTLTAVEHFNKLRKFSENTIFEMVDSKIKELLDLVEYDDWLPTIRRSEVNYSVKDFAGFLENLFTSIFTNLPHTLRTLGLFRTYDFVAQRFLEILKDAPIYNRIAIENFDLDITYVENSMMKLRTKKSSNNDTGDENETEGNVSLESTFRDLRQCVELLKLDNYEDFVRNPGFRMRNYDRVKFEDGMRLIQKMQGYDNGIGSRVNTPLDDAGPNASNTSVDQQSILSSATTSKFASLKNFMKKNEDL